MRKAVLFSVIFLIFSFNRLGAQVLLDAHVNALGASTWTITTTEPNEIIILSAGGYGTGGQQYPNTPGTVTVNGNNATYLNKGEWLDFSFTWTASIWAYAAAIPGTYTCVATQTDLDNPFYFNYATSVYQPNCALTLSNIILGGVDSNQVVTTISTSITTTVNNAFIYGTVNINDNGATGTVAWSGITELDHNYISDGIDGSQAGSTIPVAGTYTITCTDIGATNVWMTIGLIAVQPNPACCTLMVTASSQTNVSCFGGSNGSATVIADSGRKPYTYSWATSPVQTTANATGLSAGTYTVSVSDSGNCTKTASVVITQPVQLSVISSQLSAVSCNGGSNGSATVAPSGGTSPYLYSWTTTPVQTNTIATGLKARTYTVTITDSNLCVATASVTITQPNLITISTSISPTHCNQSDGSATALVGGGVSPYTYSWNPGGNTNLKITGVISSTYTVTVTDSNGCTQTASANVINENGETASVKTIKNVTCFNLSDGTASPNVTGGTSPYTYFWTATGQTNATASGLSAGTYTLTVTDANGCTSIINATITQPAILTSNASGDTVCSGQQDTLKATASGGTAPYKYLWNPGKGNSSVYTYTVVSSTVFTLTVTDDNGCTSTSKATGNVHQTSAAAFAPSPDTLFAGNNVTFINLTNMPPNTYYWTFGDGATSTLNSPVHEYNDTGTYPVTLIVTNSYGCKDTLVEDVFITEGIKVSNVFTPNGDGINDVFLIKTGGMRAYNLQIFNRYGKKVFESQSTDIGWTGKNSSGVMEADGTYYWLLQTTDYENKTFSRNGFVELIR